MEYVIDKKTDRALRAVKPFSTPRVGAIVDLAHPVMFGPWQLPMATRVQVMEHAGAGLFKVVPIGHMASEYTAILHPTDIRRP